MLWAPPAPDYSSEATYFFRATIGMPKHQKQQARVADLASCFYCRACRYTLFFCFRGGLSFCRKFSLPDSAKTLMNRGVRKSTFDN